MKNIPDSVLSALEAMTLEIEALSEVVEMVGAAADLIPGEIPNLASSENLQ